MSNWQESKREILKFFAVVLTGLAFTFIGLWFKNFLFLGIGAAFALGEWIYVWRK